MPDQFTVIDPYLTPMFLALVVIVGCVFGVAAALATKWGKRNG